MSVVLETSIGDFTVDLYTNERPICCRNFLKLCKMKYYNFSLIHTVQRNFIAQSGDPTGSGRGGESYMSKLYGEQASYFEMETKPRIKHKKAGSLSMVNNGNSMHGSQFFVTLAPDLDYLDGVHTVFGEIAEGFEILTALNETITDENNHPYQDIRIFHTIVLDDPYDDPEALREFIPERSPSPTKEILDSGRIGVNEQIDDTEGLTLDEIEEMYREKQAKANAELLEIVGDLPDAEVAPEDNILFVCKLNPVTTSEDLEIIFSRFGSIKSCEVIKDQKSGESLQYAFIEFETTEHCENAYFKMDNVLIDDRRIHVDFSQSVSKLHNQYKDSNRKSFKIKNQVRKDDYDFVFDDSPDNSQTKKEKKKKNYHSKSPERELYKKHKSKYRDSRSPSEPQTYQKSHHHSHGEHKEYKHDKSSWDSKKRHSSTSESHHSSSKKKKHKSHRD